MILVLDYGVPQVSTREACIELHRDRQQMGCFADFHVIPRFRLLECISAESFGILMRLSASKYNTFPSGSSTRNRP